MKKSNRNKQLSVSQQMNHAEMQGSKVAKIMNKARAEANKVLAKDGFEVNITVDFVQASQDPSKEVDNG